MRRFCCLPLEAGLIEIEGGRPRGIRGEVTVQNTSQLNVTPLYNSVSKVYNFRWEREQSLSRLDFLLLGSRFLEIDFFGVVVIVRVLFFVRINIIVVVCAQEVFDSSGERFVRNRKADLSTPISSYSFLYTKHPLTSKGSSACSKKLKKLPDSAGRSSSSSPVSRGYALVRLFLSLFQSILVDYHDSEINDASQQETPQYPR